MSVNHHVGSGKGHCVGSGKGHIIWSDKDQSEGHPGVRVKVRVSFFFADICNLGLDNRVRSAPLYG